MADVRRTKRSRVVPVATHQGTGSQPEASGDAPPPPLGDDRADDDAERALAKMFAVGVPLVGAAAGGVAAIVGGLPQALLVFAGTALIGTIGFFWASLRTLSGHAPLGAGVASHALASRVVAPERKREALRALKDLEFEHSVGKIDDADFHELEERYRATAKAVMREMDADLAPRREEAERLVAKHLARRERDAEAIDAEREPARAAARVACPKCRASNEPDAAFCKKCGAPLPSAPETTAAAAKEDPDAAV
jgi:hypothetical protein